MTKFQLLDILMKNKESVEFILNITLENIQESVKNIIEGEIRSENFGQLYQIHKVIKEIKDQCQSLKDIKKYLENFIRRKMRNVKELNVNSKVISRL